MAQDQIKDLYIQAAEHWPGLFVEFRDFKARLLEAPVAPERLVAPDLYLAIAVGKGNQAAWGAFYTEYSTFMKNVASRIVADPETTEEAVQEFCSELPHRIRKYLGLGSLRGWLVAVIPNYTRNFLRRVRKAQPLPVTEGGNDCAEDLLLSDHGLAVEKVRDDLDRRECERLLREILPKALSSLKLEWRLLLKHKYYDGLSRREIAETVFQTAETNVSKWHRKALAQLRKRLITLSARTARRGKEDLLFCIRLLRS